MMYNANKMPLTTMRLASLIRIDQIRYINAPAFNNQMFRGSTRKLVARAPAQTVAQPAHFSIKFNIFLL